MKTFLLGLLCWVAGASASHAQDKATIPYATLYNAFQKAEGVHGKDVRGAIAVVPKDKAVKPETVSFVVQAREGAQKLQVDPDGELHGLPMTDALLKENPTILTNQPKGSLQLGGGLIFTAPLATTYSYRQLSDLLDAGNAEVKKQAGMMSFVAPQAKAVQFVFFDHARQTLTVQTKANPKTLTANDKGEILLTLDQALLAENPTVSLSEKPSKVLPDL